MKWFKISIAAFCVFMCCNLLWADMPGNRPRPSVYVHFEGLDSIKDVQLYFQTDYADSVNQLSDTIWLNGGMGKPDALWVWAINNKTGKSTDTLWFFNDEQHRIVKFDDFQNNKITYTESAINVTNDEVAASSADDEEPTLIPKRKMGKLLLYTSGIAILLLIAFFIWKKRQKNK